MRRSLLIDVVGVLVLVSIISVALNVVPVLAQSTSDLLVNGDFSNGLSGWSMNVTLYVNYSWYSEFEGRSSVVVESNSSTGGRFDIYQVISVSKNTTGVYSIDLFSNSSCNDCHYML